MQTLWNKGVEAAQAVEDFTVGRDREMDMRLAKYDVMGSKAHIAMLSNVGLLPKDEEQLLQKELDNILGQIERGEFVLEDIAEDIHSQVEICLTRALGDLGKKIHSGRSRNDQVLVDLKLYMRAELEAIREACAALGDWRLIGCSLTVTLEPCPMCAGAIINARIPTVIFGAREPVSGSCGRVIDLFFERYGHQPKVYSGVLEPECASLLREFFADKR